jgi:hypothetical protein
VFEEVTTKLSKKAKNQVETNDTQKIWSIIARNAAKNGKSDIELPKILSEIQTTFHVKNESDFRTFKETKSPKKRM